MHQLLARLQFPVGESRGRRYPQSPHPYRNEFQRDRDRIAHSRAFRRLEDKTQVFGAGYSDHFRNRLTHTIEVTQLARTVAETLGLNADLAEALALVHDIGHPPFGHAGEDELDRQMRRFGQTFDHNLHALRIIEALEQRYAGFPGLNLTFEVREGIIKHSKDLEPGDAPELDEYLPGLKPPLEAQLIDIADECAYNAADLDDAYSAGLITLEDLPAVDPLLSEICESVETQYPAAPERARFQEVLRHLINLLVSGLIEQTATVEAPTIEDVRRAPVRLAALTPETARLGAALKAFLSERVYNSASLTAERERSTIRVGELFEFYLDHPDLLPSGYSAEPRSVCDYIAGMTDGFFSRTATELLGR